MTEDEEKLTCKTGERKMISKKTWFKLELAK